MTEIRAAIRALRGAPVISLVAILSLALGIGANTAIFSIIDSLLLRSLPVLEPEQLAAIVEKGETSSSWTNPIWEEVRNRPELFEGAFAWSSARFDRSRGGETDFVQGIWASGDFFDVLGVPAILGRTFGRDDDSRGGAPDGPVAVISYRFWQNQFGGDAAVIGRTLTLDRVDFTIIGITPAEFFGPEVGGSFDVAVPLGAEPLIRGSQSFLDKRSTWWLEIMARLKKNQDPGSAGAALQSIQSQIREATLPENWRSEDLEKYLKEPLELIPASGGTSFLRRRYQQPLVAIMFVVGLVLLIACANIANLMLARAAARRHELSVRLALGASRLRLSRQLLTESLLLSGAGATLGLLFARWGSRLLVQQLSAERSRVFLDMSLDWRVLGFTTVVAVGTAVLFGIVPALQSLRVQPGEVLKEKGRGVTGERRFGLRGVLVIAQVALSLVLVIGAGLFVQTFADLATQDLGFQTEGILVVNISSQRSELETAQRIALYERVRLAAESVPGVAKAGVSVITPMSNSAWISRIEVEGQTPLPEKEQGAYMNFLSPGWFQTVATPLLTGRDFVQTDKAGSPHVGIVNEAFIRHFLAGESPLGRIVRETGGPRDVEKPPIEIVGLVRDAVYRSLRQEVPPTLYIPLAQSDRPPTWFSVSVRSAGGSPSLLIKSLSSAISEVDPDLALTFRPFADQIDAALVQERMVAMLSAFFGGLALLLAGLGLYGVTSYSVSRRRTEIGIRMALGANPSRVVRMVLGNVAVMVGLGVVAGSLIGLWVAGFAETLLYGLKPHDPTTLVAAALVLSIVGALSGWLPAHRAARIDPARVLRDE